jgi:hypothetical protein
MGQAVRSNAVIHRGGILLRKGAHLAAAASLGKRGRSEVEWMDLAG